MNNHKDLDVWKQSIDFVTSIYNITREFPKEELYGLTNQIRKLKYQFSLSFENSCHSGPDPESIKTN